MMTLTEKAQWRTLINKRINRCIEDMWASDPHLKSRIEDLALESAYQTLGLSKFRDELLSIDTKIKELAGRTEDIEFEMAKVADPNFDSSQNSYCRKNVVQQRLDSQTKREKRLLMLNSTIGRAVLDMKEELDNTEEAILLATGPSAIKDFFSAVCKKLDSPMSKITKAAVKVRPSK